MDVDFSSIERKWQGAWAAAHAFEPRVDTQRKKFFLTVPYPYVTGPLHVGHGRSYTVGDMIARFKRMQGFNVLWPIGFHITGTPVLAVSGKISRGEESAIKLYREYVNLYENDEERSKHIVASFTDPWNVVRYFSTKIIQDFQKMGYSLDLTRTFTSGDAEYNKFVEWQFLTYQELGLLKQSSYPILYCPQDQNAVGEDDIQDADTDPVSLKQFVAVKSELKDEKNVFLVSATLRPETVFGITNVFVNPGADYVKAKVEIVSGMDNKKKTEEWIVSVASARKLALQGHAVKAGRPFKGKELVGKECVTATGLVVPVFPAAFVNQDNATGVVHSVPAHAPWDYIALKELQEGSADAQFAGTSDRAKAIKPIPLMKTPGLGELPGKETVEKMGITSSQQKQKIDEATDALYKKEFYESKMNSNCQQFEGDSCEQARINVSAFLKRNGKAFDVYETSRPALCRCGAGISVAVLEGQWFIDFNAGNWKTKATEALNGMRIMPELYRKQFQDVFAWLDKRPCARKRGIGTPLPMQKEWIVESLSDSTLYMALYPIMRRMKEEKIPAEKMSKEFFDFVFLAKGTDEEVAHKTGVHAATLRALREEFAYWYPNDLRHTAVAHITNHLSFFIFAHAAIFPEEQWPKAITLNEMVVSEGAKMSKSKGNVVLLNDLSQKHGADLFRLYALSSADLGSTLDFRLREVETTAKAIRRFWKIANDMADYSMMANGSEKPTAESRFAIAMFERNLAQATKALEEFSFRTYAQKSFFELVNSFEEFLKNASDEEKKLVSAQCIERWVRMLSPVMPHLAEELYAKARGEGFCSLAQWPEAREELVDERAIEEHEFVNEQIENTRRVIELIKAKPGKVTFIVASTAKREALEKAMAESMNIGELRKRIADDALFTYAQKRFNQFKQGLKKVDEYEALSAHKEKLVRMLGMDVLIQKEEESANERAKLAMPLKPSVAFE